MVKKILVVFDINGTLAHRLKNTSESHPAPSFIYSNTTVIPRPHLTHFLSSIDFVSVGIWTSMPKAWAEQFANKLFPKRVQVVMGGNWCSIGATRSKIKDLNVFFTSRHLNRESLWNATNTIIVDDSVSKGSANMDNMILIPVFNSRRKGEDINLLILLDWFLKHRERFEAGDDVRDILRTSPIEFIKSNK